MINMNIQTQIKFHYSTKDGQNKNPMRNINSRSPLVSMTSSHL